jgi:hypothetical protein
VRTDPRKHFERVLSIGLLQLSLGAPCHASLGEDGDSLLSDSTTCLSRMRKKAVQQGRREGRGEAHASVR